MEKMTDSEAVDAIRIYTKTFRLLAPVNLAQEKNRFFKKKNYNPQFDYPAQDEDQIKIFKARLRQVKAAQGTSLKNKIFNEKLTETNIKLGLIASVGNAAKLTRYSERLYRCKFTASYIKAAKRDSALNGTFYKRESLTAFDARRKIAAYLAGYGIRDWRIIVQKNKDFYIQIRYKKELITINKSINWDQGGLDTLLAHEIDGHVLRAVNALNQKQKVFQSPLPFYIKTEEGLASYLGDYHSEDALIARKHHAIKYLAGYIALNNSFHETYNFLCDFGFTPELAFQRAFRLKRGLTDTSEPGCFAREAIYYEGMRRVKHYIDSGNSLEDLYAGKVGLNWAGHIPHPQKILLPKRLVS